MTKALWKISAAVGVLAVGFLMFWMNRFQYEHCGAGQAVLVRINRLTGQHCFLIGNGSWDSRFTALAKSDNYVSPFAESRKDAEALFGKDKDLDNLMYGEHNRCQ